MLSCADLQFPVVKLIAFLWNLYYCLRWCMGTYLIRSLALYYVSYNKCTVCVQVIIEKAYESTQKDHVKDALSLFVDFMAIFVSPLSPPSQVSLPLRNMCVSTQ